MSISRARRAVTSIWGLFVVAYLATTAANTALTLVYTAVAETPSAPELGVPYLLDPAYQATVPFHIPISLLIWLGAAVCWIRWRRGCVPDLRTALRTGAAWLALTMLVDAAGYVLILGETRWGLPLEDFYLGNQPWITLTYLTIVLAPLLVQLVDRRHGRPAGSAAPTSRLSPT